MKKGRGQATVCSQSFVFQCSDTIGWLTWKTSSP